MSPSRDAPSSADERAFRRLCRQQLRRRILQVTLVSMMCFGTAWLLGGLTLPLSGLAMKWLALMTSFALVAQLAYRFVPVASRHPLAVAAGFQGTLCASAGAMLAGGGDAANPFVYAIFLLPPLAMGLPMGPGARLGITLLGPGAFTLAYLAATDGALLKGPPLMVGTATSLVCVVLGDQVYRGGRERFLAERALARHRDTLKREVAARAEAVAALRRSLERASVDRADVARDLHDDLGQLIVRVRMELDLLERELSDAPADAEVPLEVLSGVVEMLDRSVRDLIARVRTPEPVTDLATALEAVVAPLRVRSGVTVTTDVHLETELDDALREVVYRFVQETVTNVFKHAGATHLHISVADEHGTLVAETLDDGRGVASSAVLPEKPSGGGGLSGLRERAEALGGKLTVTGRIEGGTQVHLRLPRLGG
ncbi:MAG: histidine kinase [Myxococcota bacterium]